MKRKLLFIIPSFKRGGVERVTLNILNSLDTTLFEVDLLICCNKGNNDLIKFTQDNIKITELECKNVRQSLPSMINIISKNKPSLIFTSFDHLSLPILLYKSVFRKKYKTVVRINSLPSNRLEQTKRGRFYRNIFKFAIKDSDAVIAQTNEMKEDILFSYKIDPNNVWVIRNLVNTKQILKMSDEEIILSKKTDSLSLITIGSLGAVKGYDILLKAIKELVNRGHRNIQLYIVGDNRDPSENYRMYLDKLIEELNLMDYVSLLGYKKNPYPYVKAVDAYVLSSLKEGFPNVVLEALTLGKPCIVTNCIDFDGIIEPFKNGIIVEKGSILALAEGMLEIKKIKGEQIEFDNFDYNTWFFKLIG